MPQVRSKTSGSTSIAMSQRTPSHWPAIFSSSPIIASCVAGLAVIELQRVGPAGKVRIASVGQQQIAPLALDPGVVLRRAGQVEFRAGDVILGMVLDPGMIQSRVIGNEVQHQPAGRVCGAVREAGPARHRLPARSCTV